MTTIVQGTRAVTGIDGELGTVLLCEFGLAINKLDAANFGKKAGVEDIRRYTALACVACFEMAYQIALKALDDDLGRALACKTEFWARCNEAYTAGGLEFGVSWPFRGRLCS